MSLLKLEVGKTYRSGQGLLITILSQNDEGHFVGSDTWSYSLEGIWGMDGNPSPMDLVELVDDEKDSDLVLEVGGEYLSDSGDKVFIVTLMAATDHDYVEGYPYMDANGQVYSENGCAYVSEDERDSVLADLVTVVHPLPEENYEKISEEDVIKQHEHETEEELIERIDEAWGNEAQAMFDRVEEVKVSPPPPTFLEEGRFFRNGLGQVVLIVGTVNEGNRLYKKGARFVDCRGSYYTPEGSVNSEFFKTLDLIEEVRNIDVTDEEMKKIHDWTMLLIDRENRHDARVGRILSINDSVYRFCKKSIFGLGVAQAIIGTVKMTTNPVGSLIDFSMATLAFIIDRHTPQTLKEVRP